VRCEVIGVGHDFKYTDPIVLRKVVETRDHLRMYGYDIVVVVCTRCGVLRELTAMVEDKEGGK
jgi:hypothetical protein